MTRRLKYVGNGKWLPGVPACDHTADTDAEAEERIKSGLYEPVEKRGKKDEVSDDG